MNVRMIKILISLLLGSAPALAGAPQKPTVTRDMVFSGFSNQTCYADKGRLFLSCVRLLGELVELVAHDFTMIHRSHLSKEWEVIRNADESEILDEGHLVVVKSTPARIKRLTELYFKNARQVAVDSQVIERTVDALAAYKKPPKINFDHLKNEVLNNLSSPLREEEHLIGFYLRWLKMLHDPFLVLRKSSSLADEIPNRWNFSLTGNAGAVVFGHVLPESPLDRAGAATGFKVKKIDGVEVHLSKMYEILKSVQSKDSFKIQMENGRKQTVERTVTLEEKDLHPVSSHVIRVNGVNLGYLKIKTFQNQIICEETREHLLKLKDQKVQALIYDLRNNGGGLMDQANCFLGLNFGPNVEVYFQRLLQSEISFEALTRDGVQVMTPVLSSAERVAPDVPVITLVNWATASAAEVVTAVMRERGYSWIVGQKTFGKGILQRDFEYHNFERNLSIRASFARVELPSGYSYQQHGIQPDFPVSHTLPGVNGEMFAWRFTDMFGPAWGAEKFEWDVSPITERLKKQINQCLKQSKLAGDEKTYRWLLDMQMRKSVGVALCSLQTR